MVATLFLAFVAVMAATVVTLVARHAGRRTAAAGLVGLAAWFAYVALIAHFGVVRDTTLRPPGMTFVFLPVVAFLALVVARATTSDGLRVATAIPLWVILATQSFRVVVELFLHRLWVDGLVPKMLTFAGANADVYVGASAPLVAWACMRGRPGIKLALGWNVVGLLVLANVVGRAVLTAPGPLNLIHAEVPNLMIGTFPFTFIPAFFVPLAVVLHVLAIRAAVGRLRSERPGAASGGLAAPHVNPPGHVPRS